MDVIVLLNDILKESIYSEYSIKNISIEISKIDNKINDIIDYWTKVSQWENENIQKTISIDIAWLLLCFGIRMATYSLRLSSQKLFTNGLFAISMTSSVIEKRELLVVLPLYCDVYNKKKLSFNEILKQHNKFSIILEEFINRDDKDKSLECMGYTLKVDQNNVPTYYRTW